MRKVVVLGAGYAGILTAKKLAKQVKKAKLSDVEITIIDKHPFHTMLTELHEVAAGRVGEESIRINLERVFAGRKVNVAHEEITSIDFDKKVMQGSGGNRSFDYLVMAAGSKPAFFGTPGAQEHSFTLWSYEDAIRLRDHIDTMFREAVSETDKAKRKEILTFYVVGAGFTGVEMAGELAEYVPILCNRYELDPSEVTMACVDMLDRACMVLPPKLAEKVKKRLEKMKVNVMFKTSIKGVGGDFIEYEQNGKKTQVKARTVIWTAGVEGAQITQDSSALGAGGRGCVATDDYLRSMKYPNVYVAGDNVFYKPEGEERPVPQMVENAEQSAHTIAVNLFSDLAGKGEKHKYKPAFHGVMVCIGGRWGTAHGGLPGMFFGMPSFFAMFAKHFINITYFIQVLGWNKIFSYIKHEFFIMRNKRAFVGGHFSNRGPSFFGVPMRIFLGIYWLYEGIWKIADGWLQTPKLNDFLGWVNGWLNGILGFEAQMPPSALAAAAPDAVSAASGAAEAVAAASGAATAAAPAAESTVTALINWKILGFIRFNFLQDSGASEIFERYIIKFTLDPMEWFLNAFIYPNEGMQMLMQFMICIMMVCIGLGLMGGFLTTICGVISLGFCAMFFMSTGQYLGSWWIVPASIAVMFGAGQVFSLDYYFIPWLKKAWKKTGIANKWYLYHD